MTAKVYQTSKEDCEKAIRGVCEGCGGPLTAIETVDNAHNPTFWQGCEHCQSFRSGVDPLYFKIARRLVEAGDMLPHSSSMSRADYEDSPERLEYYLTCQTATLSRNIAYIHRLLKEEAKP